MKTNIFFILCFCITTCFGQQNQTHETIGVLERALKAKNFLEIKPYLADNFVYKSFEGQTALSIMSQVVGGYPLKLERIQIKSATQIGNDKIVTCEFITPEGQENEVHEITLSQDSKIIRADVVNIQVAPHHPPKGSTGSNKIEKQLPDYLKIKGKIADNLFYVTAQLNGEPGSFMIDTGAGATLIINSDVIKLQSSDKTVAAHGSTGASAMKSIKLDQFQWEGIKWENFDGISTPLSHLGDHAGLIGSELLKDYLLVTDYKNASLSLYKLGTNQDEKVLAGFEQIKTYKVAHLPVIEVEINDKKYYLAVDTGATKLLMDKSYLDELNSAVTLSAEKGHLKGAGKEEVEVDKGVLKNFKINNHSIPDVNIVFADQPKYDHGSQRVDGIIGHDILKEGQFALNLETGEMYLKI